MFQQTWISEDSPLASYLSLLEDGFCPYLRPAKASGYLYFSQYDLGGGEAEATRARLFLLGLIHTEWMRHKRLTAQTPEQRLLTCENLIVDVGPDVDGPSLFGWPHFILKALYTESALLFGKFWIGEKDFSCDGRPVPVPPLHLLSIRSAIKKKDHRFFQRVMEGMLPEFERGHDCDGSPLRNIDWLPSTTTDQILALAASNPSQDDVIALVNELINANVYPSARRWAEGRLKEIKQMEHATNSIRILGQLLPKLVESVGAQPTCVQQITDRRGAAVWRVDTHGSGSFALKYVTQGEAGPHDPVILVRREGAVLKEVGSLAGEIFVDAGEIDGTPFLVTRWLEGAVSSDKLAKQLLQEGTEPDIARLILLAERMTESVARVHAAGWVHGDVQPAHFLVDPQTTVQLVDWALARRENRSDGHSHGGCLVHYAAPEVAASMLRGDAETGYNQSAEVYGLCATLFFLFTGSVAVDYGSEPEEMGPRRLRHRLERIASGKHFRGPGSRWDNTAVVRAIQAGLQPEPGDRPPAATLLRIIRGE